MFVSVVCVYFARFLYCRRRLGADCLQLPCFASPLPSSHRTFAALNTSGRPITVGNISFVVVLFDLAPLVDGNNRLQNSSPSHAVVFREFLLHFIVVSSPFSRVYFPMAPSCGSQRQPRNSVSSSIYNWALESKPRVFTTPPLPPFISSSPNYSCSGCLRILLPRHHRDVVASSSSGSAGFLVTSKTTVVSFNNGVRIRFVFILHLLRLATFHNSTSIGSTQSDHFAAVVADFVNKEA